MNKCNAINKSDLRYCILDKRTSSVGPKYMNWKSSGRERGYLCMYYTIIGLP